MATSPSVPAPWHEILAHDLHRSCRDLTRSAHASLNHFRQAVAERLPRPRTPPASHRRLDSFAEAFSPPPPSPSSASGARQSAATPPASSYAVTREDVGRATWLFLHTLAAQYPERPTRQQQRDARALIDVLTRMYPCGECARHFSEVVRVHPPAVGGRRDFSQWMCRVHNVVNRSLGKPAFNCDYAEARWAGVECGDDDACALDLGRRR